MSEREALARSPREAPGEGAPDDMELRSVAEEHFSRTTEVSDRFFAERAAEISRACRAMARRFHRGGRLLAFGGPGPVRSDAYHVSVEFVHPVLVGKRALSALVLDGRAATRIRTLGRAEDIAVGISWDGSHRETVEGLRVAIGNGLLTVGLAGGDGGAMTDAGLDHLFVVPEASPMVVQEVQETLYHVLWELVHVYFDHRGSL